MVIEDLHWADPTTVELAGQLVAELQGAARGGEAPQWLMILTARGEFTPPWPAEAVPILSLERLAPDEVADLVHAAVGGATVPQPLLDQVVHRADGVPLFVEEVARELVESGALNDADASAAAPPVIPTSLRDLLAARLDRLSFGARETVQMAAVLGREFRYEVLHAVAGRAERVLRDELRELVQSGLVLPRRSARSESYVFKHALVRDVAYDGMLRAVRVQAHQRVAAALRQRFPEVATQQPEVVAQHYEAGDEIGDAVDYWTLAGDRAASRGAYREAIQAFERGTAPGRVAAAVARETRSASSALLDLARHRESGDAGLRRTGGREAFSARPAPVRGRWARRVGPRPHGDLGRGRHAQRSRAHRRPPAQLRAAGPIEQRRRSDRQPRHDGGACLLPRRFRTRARRIRARDRLVPHQELRDLPR
jgi:hypothetical protein